MVRSLLYANEKEQNLPIIIQIIYSKQKKKKKVWSLMNIH